MTATTTVDTLSPGDVVAFPHHPTLRNTRFTVFAVDCTYDGRWVLGLRTNGHPVTDPCNDKQYTERLRHVCPDGTQVASYT